MAGRSSGGDYARAVQAIVAASAREEQALAATREDDMMGTAESQRRVDEALRSVDASSLARPLSPTSETGNPQQLSTLTRKRVSVVAARADEVVEAAARVAAGEAARTRERDLMMDLAWRVSLPFAGGFVATLLLAPALSPVLAAAACGVAAALLAAAFGAYAFRLLLATSQRTGLSQIDAGLVLGGGFVTAYAAALLLLDAGSPVPLGLLSTAACYVSAKRVILWRSSTSP